MNKSVTKIIDARILRPREVLISHLEKLLDRAKAGELTGIVSVSVWQGQNVAHGWSLADGDYLRTVLGEIDILKHHLIDDELERSSA